MKRENQTVYPYIPNSEPRVKAEMHPDAPTTAEKESTVYEERAVSKVDKI